jgi:CDP-paratose 2-epimerase
VNGDVRKPEDLSALPSIDALVECSAEPSVMSGVDGDTSYLFETNLVGAYNCLELARREQCQFVFLSSSRVYPLAGLRSADFEEVETRFELTDEQPQAGLSRDGVAENMPIAGPRTLYGSTKLAAELLVAEYGEQFPVSTVVNRCGVIAGPWQMGKVDQGVFSWWLLSHLFKRPLSYIGFEGSGRQVRDLLHIDDLVALVDEQLVNPDHWTGATANVGGGREGSLSLLETTALCQELTGNEVPIAADIETRPGDVPVYLSDCAHLHSLTSWRPENGPREVLEDLLAWSIEHEDSLRSALNLGR